MILQAEKVSKVYGSGEGAVTALKEVELMIGQGEFTAITGPSGSGKSTLLHILSALDSPTQGRILADGISMSSKSDKELSEFRRKKFGFIFQQFNLVPVLTAKENIAFPVLLDRQKPDWEYLGQLADSLGIYDRLDHLPHQLSGGQQQRVAVARALAVRPEIIFADEPTGNLDQESGWEVMKLLTDMTKRLNRTLVVVTHDRKIADMAERRIQIVDGEIKENE